MNEPYICSFGKHEEYGAGDSFGTWEEAEKFMLSKGLKSVERGSCYGRVKTIVFFTPNGEIAPEDWDARFLDVPKVTHQESMSY